MSIQYHLPPSAPTHSLNHPPTLITPLISVYMQKTTSSSLCYCLCLYHSVLLSVPLRVPPCACTTLCYCLPVPLHVPPWACTTMLLSVCTTPCSSLGLYHCVTVCTTPCSPLWLPVPPCISVCTTPCSCLCRYHFVLQPVCTIPCSSLCLYHSLFLPVPVLLSVPPYACITPLRVPACACTTLCYSLSVPLRVPPCACSTPCSFLCLYHSVFLPVSVPLCVTACLYHSVFLPVPVPLLVPPCACTTQCSSLCLYHSVFLPVSTPPRVSPLSVLSCFFCLGMYHFLCLYVPNILVVPVPSRIFPVPVTPHAPVPLRLCHAPESLHLSIHILTTQLFLILPVLASFLVPAPLFLCFPIPPRFVQAGGWLWPGGRRLLPLALCYASAGAALLSKEQGITVLGLCVAYDCFLLFQKYRWALGRARLMLFSLN